jgi:hypothetical protein
MASSPTWLVPVLWTVTGSSPMMASSNILQKLSTQCPLCHAVSTVLLIPAILWSLSAVWLAHWEAIKQIFHKNIHLYLTQIHHHGTLESFLA